MRSFVFSAVVLLAGCVGPAPEPVEVEPASSAAADPVCPTASPGAPSLFVWHTTRRLEHVVWSSDNQQIGGVEYVFEEKLSWNPFAGTTDKRKHCHQLSLYDTHGKFAKYVGPLQPNQVSDIKLMAAGYFTTESYQLDFDGWDFHRVTADKAGARALLAHADVGCQYGAILPSPNGSQIAYFDVAGHCDNDGQTGNDVAVTFFDANGAQQARSAYVPLPGGAWETWTPAGDLILTDLSKAVRVSVVGTTAQIADAPVPHCTDPATTSSPVAADGRTLTIDASGKIVIAAQPSTPFGCQ